MTPSETHRIPIFDPGPIESYVDPSAGFHCVFGLHEAFVNDGDGDCHCDVCGMSVTHIDVPSHVP